MNVQCFDCGILIDDVVTVEDMECPHCHGLDLAEVQEDNENGEDLD